MNIPVKIRCGWWGFWLVAVCLLAGCGLIPEEKEKEPVEFVVISEAYIPGELAKMIEEKKNEVMKLTYVDQGKHYIVVGYGKQKSGGFSIVIRNLVKAGNALYLDTVLLGPEKKPQTEDTASYPYLVIQTRDLGLPVVFQ